VARLAQQRPAVSVVAIDKDHPAAPYPSVTTKQVDLADADLAALFSGADSVVHLASTVTAGTLNPAEVELEAALLHRVLDPLDSAAVPHLVVMSSAMVYGAWKDNPVPLTEDAPARPTPDFDWAVQRHRLERLAQQWGQGPGRSVTVLRPAPVVSSGLGGPIGEAMLAAAPIRTGSDDPPVQFLHLDDLASAVVLATQRRLSGVFNVAPDGWLSPGELRALLGARPKIRLPMPLPKRLDRYVARRVGHAAPAGLLPYTRYSWVVANDRLRAEGWEPRYSSAQAFVIADAGMPWDDLNARQRQYATLVGAGAAVAAGGWAAAAWLRRSYALR